MGNNWGHVKENHPQKPDRLLDLAKEILRRKHYSIRNQAFNALLFLYKNVLNISLEGAEIDAIRARKKRNLPVVLTKDEVKRVIMAMPGVHQLMPKLLYGSERLTFKDFNKVLTWTDMQSMCTH